MGISYQPRNAPGGSDTQVQFNDGGIFGGDSALTFDESLPLFSLTGDPQGDDYTGTKVLGKFESTTPAATNGDVYAPLSGISIVTDTNASGSTALGMSVMGEINDTSDVASPASGQGLEIWARTSLAATANFNSSRALVGATIFLNHQAASDLEGMVAVDIWTPGNTGNINSVEGILIRPLLYGGTNIALHIADQGSGANDYAIKVEGGIISLSGLPTSDPLVAGQVWNNHGVLCISIG